MATLTLNIQTANTDAKVYQSPDAPNSLAKAAVLVRGLAAGAIIGSVEVQRSDDDLVAASGTITVTEASVSADDTVTIAGVAFTAKASGATGDQWNNETDDATSATNLAAAINANATLSPHVKAVAASGVVTLTAKLKGSIGNLLVMSKSSSGLTLSQMASGAGGPEGTAIVMGR